MRLIHKHAHLCLVSILVSNLENIIEMKNSIAIICFVSLTGILSSCDSFLSQNSTIDVADSDMFTDAASLESARIGLYNSLQNQYYYGGYYQLILDAYSDNGATGGYDNLDLDELGLKEASADNIYIQNVWTAIYNTIYAANQIIANVDLIEDETLSDAVRNDIKGEALAIRGMAHFDLLKIFGEHWDATSMYGIPVVTEVLDATATRGRNTVAETYTAILDDLLAAEALLSDTDPRYEDVMKGKQFMTKTACTALLARVYRANMNMPMALEKATAVISSGYATVADGALVGEIYATKFSDESIFELAFNAQDKSAFNSLTYAREDALRSEVNFLAANDLKTFFEDRTGDVRADLLDFESNDVSIEPDGRTQKYRGEVFQDNSAYIIRISELLLIQAEAQGFPAGNTTLWDLQANRGMDASIIDNEDQFYSAIMAERRAELNFEGDRYADLAHFGKVAEVLGDGVLPCLPIPNREIGASGGLIEQYPGY